MQANPAVAMDASGDFVVTWKSYTGSGYDIFAQRFGARVCPRGPEFRVNSTTANDQKNDAWRWTPPATSS